MFLENVSCKSLKVFAPTCTATPRNIMSTDQYEHLYFKYIFLSMWIILVIVLFIILFIELRTHIDQLKKSSRHRVVILFTLMSYTFYLIEGVSGALAVYGVRSCTVFNHTAPIAYTFAKCFMYFVYIYRVHIVYSKSRFAYSKCLLLALFSGVVMNTIFQTIFYLFTAESRSVVTIYHYANGEKLCRTALPTINLVSTAVLDLIIASLSTYLFIRPLLKLKQFQARNNPTRTNTILFNMARKYSLLAFLSVSSTVLILGCIQMSKIASLITIDIVINSVCMMFFNKQYDDHYKIVCCAAIAGWRRLFDVKIMTLESSDDHNDDDQNLKRNG
eukprot:828195_1